VKETQQKITVFQQPAKEDTSGRIVAPARALTKYCPLELTRIGTGAATARNRLRHTAIAAAAIARQLHSPIYQFFPDAWL
jgi:hypothetical protein